MDSLFFIVPVALLLLGFPIFLVLLIAALVWLTFVSGMPPSVIQTVTYGSLKSFSLLAIPFFIFAGEVIAVGGIAKRVIDWVLSLIGGIPGSLGVATIASSELFGAMSGSAVGSVAAVGRLLLPALKENGYGERFSVGVIASSGAIAVVIPPSIAMIIYSVVAQQSLTDLFIAGILPALLIGLMDAGYVLAYAKIKKFPVTSGARWGNVLGATKSASWALGTIVVIFGGIYGGVFTPTEAAGIAAVYAIAVSIFVYGDMRWHDVWRCAEHAASLTSQILLIVAAAGVYSWMLTTSGIPQIVVNSIQALHAGPVGTLLLLNVLLFIVGSFLQPIPSEGFAPRPDQRSTISCLADQASSARGACLSLNPPMPRTGNWPKVARDKKQRITHKVSCQRQQLSSKCATTTSPKEAIGKGRIGGLRF